MRHAREPYEFDALATYNAEVARGIVHTPEWKARMRREQERFDAQQQAFVDCRREQLRAQQRGGWG